MRTKLHDNPNNHRNKQDENGTANKKHVKDGNLKDKAKPSIAKILPELFVGVLFEILLSFILQLVIMSTGV